MKILKWLLDIVITAALLLLMNTAFTGMALHEWLGLGLILLFVVHLCVNGRWIRGALRHLSAAPGKVKLRFGINAALLVLVILTALSGILISKVVFPALAVSASHTWTTVHILAAYGLLILSAVHIGLHGTAILTALRRLFHLKSSPRWRTVTLRVISALVALLGIYALITVGGSLWTRTQTGSEGNGFGGGFAQGEFAGGSRPEGSTGGNGFSRGGGNGRGAPDGSALPSSSAQPDDNGTLPSVTGAPDDAGNTPGELPSDHAFTGEGRHQGYGSFNGVSSGNYLLSVAQLIGLVGLFACGTYYIGQAAERHARRPKAETVQPQ